MASTRERAPRDPVVKTLIDEVLGEEEQEKKRRKTGKSVRFSQDDKIHSIPHSEEVRRSVWSLACVPCKQIHLIQLVPSTNSTSV
jgi:hypothetical protein